jgi:phage shock protein A
MGMFSRMSTIVKSKMNRMLDQAEDPRETLDYSYEKQLEMLQNVKRGVVEMVTAKRRIQQQAAKVRENIERLERQAKHALEADREDLARLALQRKQNALIELQGLDEQIEGMEQEQQKLTTAEQRLQAKVDAFRNKKEIIKAQYTAAQAQVRIGSALGGISEEMSDVSMAMQRAENKTDQLKAKAGAIDELVEAGVLDDFNGPRDAIERELAQISISQGVEEELAALKGGGRARTALPSAQTDIDVELETLRNQPPNQSQV